MPRLSALFAARHAPSLAVLAITCLGVAGCSSDVSRFSANSARPAGEVTGSVSRQPTGQVQSQALPPPGIAAPRSYPTQQVAGGGRGLGSYHPNQPVETTGAVPGASQWQPQGGISIIVGSSDSVDILARRYNVPAQDILRANNMASAAMLQPGQRLIIPRSSARATYAPAIAAPRTAPVSGARQTAAGTVHIVQSGETMMALSRRYQVTLSQIAAANSHLTTSSQLRIGERVTIPGSGAKIAQAAPAARAPTPHPAPQRVAVNAPRQAQARLVSAEAEMPAAKPAANPVKQAEATGGLPSFRWPVRGRVIAGYGAKTNGKANDGINLSVPEGTQIKAAEDGVVAYAGNELKGYGNLVLVRHSSGYVTAYAHASEISVKRGDQVRRGQVIGRAGQTGDVTSPQLHFEIRKGSAPVDPAQFLSGA